MATHFVSLTRDWNALKEVILQGFSSSPQVPALFAESLKEEAQLRSFYSKCHSLLHDVIGISTFVGDERRFEVLSSNVQLLLSKVIHQRTILQEIQTQDWILVQSIVEPIHSRQIYHLILNIKVLVNLLLLVLRRIANNQFAPIDLLISVLPHAIILRNAFHTAMQASNIPSHRCIIL